jgi:hypothetical protein
MADPRTIGRWVGGSSPDGAGGLETGTLETWKLATASRVRADLRADVFPPEMQQRSGSGTRQTRSTGKHLGGSLPERAMTREMPAWPPRRATSRTASRSRAKFLARTASRTRRGDGGRSPCRARISEALRSSSRRPRRIGVTSGRLRSCMGAGAELAPEILVNIFQVAEANVSALLLDAPELPRTWPFVSNIQCDCGRWKGSHR